MFRNRSVPTHSFAMVPRAEIPRSTFNRQWAYKSTFDAGYLIPVYCDEVLPGDTFQLNVTMFCRMSTPVFPIMDNLVLDSFFFFVPNRLLWSNWPKFMGEQANPADSISYTVPIHTCPVGGYAIGSLQDYMGLPTVGQMPAGNAAWHNALHLRAYNLIWNQWFRDENLQNSVVVDLDDGPDTVTDYVLLRRGKRHDYFTSAIPWPQKGGTSVSIPLGTSATVKASSGDLIGTSSFAMRMRRLDGTAPPVNVAPSFDASQQLSEGSVASTASSNKLFPTNLYADLSSATAATINQLRQAFQIQKLLERDARGGTRYTEIVRSHFGVVSPDARLQRPEYLGGGSTPVTVHPVAQTSATGLTGGTSPVGTLSAFVTAIGHGHGFSASFTEHGVLLGLVAVRADLTYQQGIQKMWNRATRYDFYFPAFAMLGEQVIKNKEIYVRGDANDELTFGYQERWAEYRYFPSMITSKFRSTAAGTLDAWHLSQKFTALPTLNTTFIQDTPPLSRVLAAGAAADGQQFIFDAFYQNRATRLMPMYSVPGLIDHF